MTEQERPIIHILVQSESWTVTASSEIVFVIETATKQHLPVVIRAGDTLNIVDDRSDRNINE